MIRLGVNLDHVATLRQARMETYPDPVQSALLAEIGGADNITCHLREDRRHMQDRDIKLLRETIQVPMNLEIAATEEMLKIAGETKPHTVTLVPEKREELTTEGGMLLASREEFLGEYISKLKDHGILVALFIEADLKDIELSKELGADAVELHTGEFCRKMEEARRTDAQWALVDPLAAAGEHAKSIGLQVHLGHGLNYTNTHWMQAIPGAEEANIGHAIVARAVYVGLETAVREMKDLLNDARYRPVR